MKYEIEISEQADKDLRNIYEYILSLDTMPEKYRIYDKEPWKSRGLHILPVDNYVVLYIPDIETKVVTILRIMYSGRDIDNQLYRK